MTLFTRMKRRYTAPAKELYTDPKPHVGAWTLPESSRNLDHARRLRAGKASPGAAGDCFRLLLEGVILLAVVVMSLAGCFWLSLCGSDPASSDFAFSVMLWAAGAGLALCAVLLVFNLSRRS